MMAIYKGVLEMLGSAMINNKNGSRKYSVIEIGGHSLRNVTCTQYLANYLDTGLSTGEVAEIEMYEQSKVIMAVCVGVVPGLVMGLSAGSLITGAIMASVAFMFPRTLTFAMPLQIASITIGGKKYKN